MNFQHILDFKVRKKSFFRTGFNIYSLDGNKTLRYDNYNLIFVENLRRVYESRRDNG